MKSGSCSDISTIISILLLFSLLFSPVFSSKDFREENRTSIEGTKLNMKSINARLRKINKPFVKPFVKLIKTPPELPKGHDNAGNSQELNQLWNSNGESCPNGTIPIRRTTASDIISISNFGKKYGRKDIPSAPAHEHAFGYANNGKFYGAKAVLNIWKPNVIGDDFSLSQIWVLGDVPNRPVNSVEVGWQAYPSHNHDNLPRLFTYWTPNGYRSGCYNLDCPGFVHTSQRISLGAAINPVSTYNGQQYDVAFMIWKDPKTLNWWLKVGNELVGYWPATLFTDLRDHATTIEYGGEVFSPNLGRHTSTQMGSGHFPYEGFKSAAYARNLEVTDFLNQLVDVPNLQTSADKPNCYDVQSGFNSVWRNYIFFGGSGYNPKCP